MIAAQDIHGLVAEHIHKVLDDDEFNQVIASTNTDGWDIKTFTCELAENKKDYPQAVRVKFIAKGEQRDGRTYSGNEVEGVVFAEIDHNGELSFTPSICRLVEN